MLKFINDDYPFQEITAKLYFGRKLFFGMSDRGYNVLSRIKCRAIEC
jgi:hypothetical protein